MKSCQRILIMTSASAALYLVCCVVLASADEPAERQKGEEAATNKRRDQASERAKALYAEANQLFGQGRSNEAKARIEESLSALNEGYPSTEYPKGHPDIVTALSGLGALAVAQGQLELAAQRFDQSLVMSRRLYPIDEYPQGHPTLLAALQGYGLVLRLRFQYARSLQIHAEALDVCQRLFPRERYPDGDIQLAKFYLLHGMAANLTADTTSARPSFEAALKMFRHFYDSKSFPDGHVDIAVTLLALGGVERFESASSPISAASKSERAIQFFKEALAMYRRLFPDQVFPVGQANIATVLTQIGLTAQERGDLFVARAYLTESIALSERLRVAAKQSVGPPEMASALQGIMHLLGGEGASVAALPYAERALAIFQANFGPDKFPQGHPYVVTATLDVARLSLVSSDYARAEEFAREALAVSKRLYPDAGYPNGELSIANSMSVLARTSLAKFLYAPEGVGGSADDLAEAADWSVKAVAMVERLLPKESTNTIAVRNLLASVREAQGDFVSAGREYEASLAMCRRLFDSKEYPHGDINTAWTLTFLGANLLAQGAVRPAIDVLVFATAMWQNLLDDFAATSSEAEAVTYTTTAPPTLGWLISFWPASNRPADELYDHVWGRRGSVARSMARRQRALRDRSDPELAALFDALSEARRQLSRLALARADVGSGPTQEIRSRLQQLVERKESLERALAQKFPKLVDDGSKRSHRELSKHLPRKSVFVDLCMYGRVTRKDGGTPSGRLKRTLSYVAFIVSGSRATEMVPIGPAAPIDAATREWRQAIADGGVTDAPARLRQLLWEQIDSALPADTEVVYLSPDGPITAIPWTALPGTNPGTVLLEQYALPVVPNGPFLLDRLTTADQRARKSDNVVLAVGDAAYDDKPPGSPDSNRLAAMHAAAGVAGREVRWPKLPGTRDEMDDLRVLVGSYPTTILTGRAATCERVFHELPLAGWAIFATHGFFADSTLRSALQLDENIFEKRDFLLGGERTTPVGRNPLILSGLVFAGANLPIAKDEFGNPMGDGGILTAEVIASLPLENLQLAVLSACDTGLGEVAGGEGVFGLQRAFHQAGATNVVASLWKLDDSATAALMRLFYFKLFRESKPPIIALREAQLAIYHNPGQIGSLASARAPQFAKAVKLIGSANAATETGKAATRFWAGFILSGAGR
jgi:CHAT domain-containing protein/tetratricopeptide (TPR) repeat protein